MKRRPNEPLHLQVMEMVGRLFAGRPQENYAPSHPSASQKVEFMKPNARAMRIMSKSRSDRGSRDFW